MAAKDRFHNIVKIALEKEGWKITHDPLTLKVDAVTDLHIDLGAEMLIGAERENEKIAIEKKTQKRTVCHSSISKQHNK